MNYILPKSQIGSKTSWIRQCPRWMQKIYIFIERFWKSIKQEYIYINPPNGGKELYDGIEEYIRFYNHERLHQSLDRKTPAEVFYGRKVEYKKTKYLTTLV